MGALVEITEVSLADPLLGLHGGFLDEPRAGKVLDTRAVDVLGWALGADRRAVAAEFTIDGRVVARAPLRAPRPDLATAFPTRPDAGSAGFRTTLNLLGTPPEFELQVAIVLKGRQRPPLATIRGCHRWRCDRAFAELVSVVITCCGQAHFLGETIESVLAQSYPHLEIVVVEEESLDSASSIASRYPGVRCARERSSGMACARNVGIRDSNGDFLVFLAAGDRLLPEAIEVGVRELEAHPECPAAVGAYARTTHHGRSMDPHEQPALECDQYACLMRANRAGFPARAIYRRSLFEHVRGFDPAVDAAADFAFNLAVAREFPLASHETLVAEHRERGVNTSDNAAQMLVQMLAAMRQQRAYVRGDAELRRAYREGVRGSKRHWGDLLVEQARTSLRERRLDDALCQLSLLLRHRPTGLARLMRPAPQQPG